MLKRSQFTTELVIRNELAELARVSEALRRVGAAHRISDKPLTELQVAVDEVVSNVIRHAWPEGGPHAVQVRIGVQGDAVVIEVEDDGVPFDPLGAPPPTPAMPGERPRPGGLGIHMTKQLVDEVAFERVDGHNHLTLTKRNAIDDSPN